MQQVSIIKDFPGASAGEARWEGGALKLNLSREPLCYADGSLHDYNLHFVVGLKNRSQAPVSFTVEVEPETRRGSLEPIALFTGPDFASDLGCLPDAAQTDTYRYFTFTADLAPGEFRVYSNTLARPYESLRNMFSSLAEATGAEASEIGRTLEGRPITAYSLNGAGYEPGRPVLLVTCGMHPPEPDTLAAEALMRRLAEDPALIAGLRLVLVPICNPDGFMHGYNGCNVNGVNFFWDFRRKSPDCPEARALWDLVGSQAPWVYVDFHAYTQQGSRKRPGPYLKPAWFYEGPAWRALAGRIHASLNAVPETRPQVMCAPSTLSQEVVERFNCISIAKYHLHLADGVDACRDLGLEVVSRAAHELRAYQGPSGLLRPLGPQKPGPVRPLLRKAFIARYHWRKFFKRKPGGCA